MKYSIYPPIGIARVGNSEDFFVAPEQRDSLGIEIDGTGREAPVKEFKSADRRTKRQAARFRIFMSDDDGTNVRPLQLGDGDHVEWGLQLGNKKDAVVRPERPPAPGSADVIPPRMDPARTNRVITAGPTQLSSRDRGPVALLGHYLATAVYLGEMRTDVSGRLLVLGGRGNSGSPEGVALTGDFYRNPSWFDDVSDGPVTARIVLADGSVLPALPAWVVVAPPDFAPAVRCMVTLYDVMTETAINARALAAPQRPHFQRDIQPILISANRLQWVHAGSNTNWEDIPTAGPTLETPGNDAAPSAVRQRVRNQLLAGATSLSHRNEDLFEFQSWQLRLLDAWVAGDFDAGAPPLAPPHEELTRAMLDSAVGETMYPGIEMGVAALRPEIYSQPFQYRLSHERITPGDITAMMAQPWQADFLACRSAWWPSQRPNEVFTEPSQVTEWLRNTDNQSFLSNVMKLGVIQESSRDGVAYFLESGHDLP